jgi:dolichyl-phosphate beta-glucosyltransferase
LLVSDGSTDKTAEIVTDFQRSIKDLRLIDYKENCGKGWAVRQGMLKAKGQVRLFMDADNATTVEHFDKMKPYFDWGANVVIGSREDRDAKGAKQAVPQSHLKQLMGDAGNLLIHLFAVRGIRDTQCGFKAFSAAVAENIFSKTKINRWGFDIEALALANKLKYKIEIIPVYWINNSDSRVHIKDYLMTFKELLQVWWWFLTDVYKS